MPQIPTVEAMTRALAQVNDPEIHRPLTELGMIKEVVVGSDGVVLVAVWLTVTGCPLKDTISKDVTKAVSTVPGVSAVRVELDYMSAEQRKSLQDQLRGNAPQREVPFAQPGSLTRVYAVASGKGGVGKSSVTANLAALLAQRGLTVGVLDADIGGFSIPRMLGVEGRVQGVKDQSGRARFAPLEKPIGLGLLKVMSMGSIEGTGEDQAIMWRGFMLNRAVQHFLEDVAWGDMHYLLIDMPPGTADIQMGLARMLPRTEVVIVTTPSLAAQQVAARAADMARKGYLRVAGVVENMSASVAPDGTRYAVFGSGGGERLAEQLGVPLLGSIPLDPAVAAGGDAGEPAAIAAPHTPAAQAFAALAECIVSEAIPLVEMVTCTARQFFKAAGLLTPMPEPRPTATSQTRPRDNDKEPLPS